MKHIVKAYLLLQTLCILFLATGCEDYLDKEYDASLSEDKVFSNTTLTKEYLANLYTFLPDGLGPFSDTQYLNASRDCMTDNSCSFWSLIYYDKIRTDSYTSSSHPFAASFWTSYFTGIRRCNVFLNSISSDVISDDATSGDDNHLYTRYKAEARLLRALFHFELVAYFGDAPIVEDVYSTDSEEMLNLTRTDAADVLEWVANECDSVVEDLPFRYSSDGSWGRVNGAAAMALKSRALLYRASPLNNTDDNTDWWSDAADAAEDLIEENEANSNPYSLYTFTDDVSQSESLPSSITGASQGTLNYMYCFITTPYNNNEVLFGRSIWNTLIIDYSLLPYGSFSGAYGRTNPTQNLVDSYETADGNFIDEDSNYDEQDPYTNRDPRLEATIFHQGSVWGRPDQGEEASVDVNSTDGVDYRGSSGGTFTGYYVKKWVNPNLVFSTGTTADHGWIIYRYAEILLNAAEAINEAEGPTNAYKYVNAVRERAGMPDLSGLTQDELRERIHNERRIELAFEDHRYFDVRRWKLYYDQTSSSETSLPYREQIYHLYGVQVALDDSDNPTYTYGQDSNIGDAVYTTPKNDLWPVPYDEVTAVPSLGQNSGW